MSWTIAFNTKQLADVFKIREDRIRSAIPQILEDQADYVLDRWRAGARGHMYAGMSRPLYSDSYAAAIQRGAVTTHQNGADVSIFNTGTTDFGTRDNGRRYDPFDFVALVENGRGPVDLKRAILEGGKSDRIKYGKNGPYIIIPFRHGAGESVHFKQNIGPEMKALARGRAGRGVSERMAREAHPRNPWMRAQLDQERSTVYGRGVHTVLGIGQQLTRTSGYSWKKPLLAGLRMVGSAGHHQFMTFRTMTLNDPGAWISPAMPPNAIWASMMRATEPEVRQRVAASIRAIANDRGFFARLRDRL